MREDQNLYSGKTNKHAERKAQVGMLQPKVTSSDYEECFIRGTIN